MKPNVSEPIIPVPVDMNYVGRSGDTFYVYFKAALRQPEWFELADGRRFREGTIVQVYDCDEDGSGNHDDLVAEGPVKFNPEMQRWYLETPVGEVLYVSELKDVPDHWVHHADWRSAHYWETGRSVDSQTP